MRAEVFSLGRGLLLMLRFLASFAILEGQDLFFQAPHDPGRNSHGQGIRWNFCVFSHHRTSADDAVVADFNAFQNCSIFSDENVMTDFCP